MTGRGGWTALLYSSEPQAKAREPIRVGAAERSGLFQGPLASILTIGGSEALSFQACGSELSQLLIRRRNCKETPLNLLAGGRVSEHACLFRPNGPALCVLCPLDHGGAPKGTADHAERRMFSLPL